MVAPMLVLVACCCFLGLAPLAVAPVLDKAVAAWAPELRGTAPALATLAPLGWISVMGSLLLTGLLVLGALLWLCLRRSAVTSDVTWGCGYVAPTPRMQYTSSSFGQILVGLFGWALRPRLSLPKAAPLFPTPTSFHSEVPDPVL